MKLTRVIAPTDHAFNVPDLITWLNVVRDDENQLLDDCATAAETQVEEETQRRLITQTWDLILPCFRPVILLPYPPLQAIVSVSYIDLTGATQVLDSARYDVFAPAGDTADPGELRPTYLELWPETRPTWNAVTIRFRCGYGPTYEEVPVGLRKTIDRVTEELYRVRGVTITTSAGARDKPIEGGLSLERALGPFRILDAWWRED